MTVRLSPHKADKILVGYFRGLPQKKIAKETGVDQSSVSHYATRFKEIAAKYGLVAAGKGYRLMDEVESLRSLSVELYKSKLTVEEARRGHDIIKAFLELGISPNKHLDLIQLCKKIDDPDFPEAAIKLSKIEARTGNNYQQLMSGFKDVIHQLPQLEKKISEKEAELKSINEGISQNKKELAAQGKKLEEYQGEVKFKESQMEKELSEKMKQMGITGREVEEVAALKAELIKKNLSIETVMKLAKEF
jgi:predicted transcriptional regulator